MPENQTTTATVEKPAAKKPQQETEFIVVIRHPKRKTLHPLLNPKAGEGALAVFESPEQAISQTEGLAILKNREFFVVPVE